MLSLERSIVQNLLRKVTFLILNRKCTPLCWFIICLALEKAKCTVLHGSKDYLLWLLLSAHRLATIKEKIRVYVSTVKKTPKEGEDQKEP